MVWRILFGLLAVLWAIRVVLFVMGRFEPEPFTVGVAMVFTSVLFAKWAMEEGRA